MSKKSIKTIIHKTKKINVMNKNVNEDIIDDIVKSVKKKKQLSKNIKSKNIKSKNFKSNNSKSKNIHKTEKTEIDEKKSYFEAERFLKTHGISISTITLDCKLHTLINVDEFSKNV